ncbi:MAG: B12-binding domain-containing radical SAM protein [Chitinophagales bacterium]|nr:B12-binding domain-containing radical SAM protein [Chitinophagales bacterium]
MKVLIINPPQKNTIKEYPDDNGQGYVETDDYGYFPPLGALYILSYAEKKLPQHEYFFKDCVGEHLDFPQIINYLQELQPDIVGITSFTISLIDVVKTAELVKECNPNSFVCLGGHHPTAFPFEAAALKQFDCIVVGEGEYAFTELLSTLENKGDITKILGVYTNDSIQVLKEKTFKDPRFLNHVIVAPAYVEDVDDIAPPNREYIKHINYNSVIGLTGKLATIITSRGCPYKCTFCDVPYKKYRQRNVELVMDEIEMCLEQGYKEFHFYDDLFNMTAQKILDFCDALERRGLSIVWDFRGRVNAVTFESLVRSKKNGLRMISFGVETGSDLGMKTLKKGTKVDQVKMVFNWCRELGIKTVANYMIGLPHEKSEQDVMENIEFLIELDPDYAQINIMNLYPHTRVHDDAIAKGFAQKGRWESFSLNPTTDFRVDHWIEHLTEKQLVQLHRKAYRKFYFRPKYILRSAIKTASLHELKAKIKGVKTLLGV